MIFWPCCCDKDCSCIGCATLKIEGASSHPDYGTSDVYTELAYNRTVVMWDKDNSTDTPFDLLGTPGDCGDDYTNYPGTKCKGQSFACCSAHYYDDTIEPVPMVVGGVTQTPPTPVAGSDCFPALSCFYDVSQPTIWLTKPEQPTHHYYVDTSGYVWLAIVSYEFVEALQALRPHWIFIYKSSEVINCQTVNSGGSEGTSFTMTAVCDGLATGVDDCSAIVVPLLDMSAATITLTIYPNVTYCCDLGDDPCNDDEGLCIPNLACGSCDNGVASGQYLVEIEFETTSSCCDLLFGSFVLDRQSLFGDLFVGGVPVIDCFGIKVVRPIGCLWANCFEINPSCTEDGLEFIGIDMRMLIYEGGIELRVWLITPSSALLSAWVDLVPPINSDCLSYNRYEITNGSNWAWPFAEWCSEITDARVYITAI